MIAAFMFKMFLPIGVMVPIFFIGFIGFNEFSPGSRAATICGVGFFVSFVCMLACFLSGFWLL
jgi:hypothetical protein